MEPVREDATDDELYEWFLQSLAAHGTVREVEPGRIRVHGDDDDEHVFLLITREQLRSVSYAEFDVFDDTDPEVIPRTSTPVATGLDTFTFFAEESLATMRPGERYLVFHDRSLRPSVREELPPERRKTFW